MHVDYTPDHDASPAGVMRATGREFGEWFRELDAIGGPRQGRRALGEALVARKLDTWWVTTLLVEYEKARGVTERDGAPTGYNICVTKSVAAQPGRVFDALLDTAWWLGPRASGSPREGETFDDGDGHSGTWKKLAPGRTMRFTWAGVGHQAAEAVEIRLSAAGAKTSVVLNHSRLPDRSAADGMRAAWGRVLDSLKEKLA